MPPERCRSSGLPGSSGLAIGGSDSVDRCTLAVVGPLTTRAARGMHWELSAVERGAEGPVGVDSLNYLIGAGEQGRWNREAESLRRLEIDGKFEGSRLLHR